MTRRKKAALWAAALVLFGACFTLSWAIWTVQRSGAIVVRIQERGGDDVAIHLPGGIVTLAALLAPDAIFQHAGCKVRDRVPVLRAVCKSLEESPDVVLVETEGGNQSVRVSKQENKLLVRIESPDEKVYVELPLFIFRTIVGKLDRAARA